jgi:hypothetical protein
MDRRSSSRLGHWLAAASLGLLAAAIGCSSGSSPSGSSAPHCASQCAAGNQCIDDGSGSGPQCHLVCTGQTCPFGYYCNDGVLSGQAADWCAPNTTAVSEPDGSSPWGTPCLPTKGESSNPACDLADGFICYGVSPTDANAFCTIDGCQQDSDCPGGWWCETVNTRPNVTTAKRSFGATRTVCKPRDYCASCKMDHDCPSAANGTQQHCVALPGSGGDAAPPGNYCSPQCASNADCTLDATCVTQWSVCTPAQGTSCRSDDDCPPASGTYQHCDSGTCTPECGSAADCTGTGQKCTSLSTCQPRAQACVGSGGFCSPCDSDADCTQGGYCLSAAYSTERYCSVKLEKGTCPEPDQSGYTIGAPGAGQCPPAPPGSSAAVTGKGAIGCTFSSTQLAPSNQCIALTTISNGNGGESDVLGCWTVNR